MNKTVMKWFQYGFILLLGLVMIYPVLWMIAGSFKTDQEILSGSLNLIPETFRWENYEKDGQVLLESHFSRSLRIRLSSLRYQRSG